MSDLCPGSGTLPAAAVDREKIADTLAEIHQSYTPELQGTQA